MLYIMWSFHLVMDSILCPFCNILATTNIDIESKNEKKKEEKKERERGKKDRECDTFRRLEVLTSVGN